MASNSESTRRDAVRMADVQVGAHVARVDDKHRARVAAHKWHVLPGRNGTIYAQTTVRQPDGKRTTVTMHRLVMECVLGRKLERHEQVDHRNHDGLDNREASLRLASMAQNLGNQRARINNTSGRKGVSWHRRHQKWSAKITIKGRQRHLGYFDDLDEATAVRDAADLKYHGEFACTNEMMAAGA